MLDFSGLDFSGPLARLLLQGLLNSLWQGALVVGLAWLLLRAAGRASAATRHAVWLVSLMAIGALPFLPFLPAGPPPAAAPEAVVRPGRAEAHGAGVAATGLTDALAPLSAIALPEGAVRATALPALARAREAWQGRGAVTLSRRAARWLLAVWLVGCAVMLGRIARSYYFLWRIRRRLGLVPSAEREQMRRLTYTFGIRRPLRLFTSPLVSVPMTIGWLRPLVILPHGLRGNLSPAEYAGFYESILAHELGHIKRWDYLTNLLQRLLEAFLFFHPAVWLLGRQLEVERELACDDWAVKLTGEPRRYASCLTRLVELLGSGKPLAAATGIVFGKHIISRRVEMILNRHRNGATSVSKPALCSALGLTGFSLAVCSFFSPVIAVPLAQDPAPRAAAPAPAATPAAPAAVAQGRAPAPARVVATPATPEARPAPEARPVPGPLDAEPPAAPRPPAVALDIDELAPVAEDADIAEVMARPVAAPAAPAAPVALRVAYAPQQAPGPARAVRIGPGESEKAGPPAISEAELIGVLSDVVKRDADPAVRNEALQGIYRFRTEAGVNALLQLYDGVTDVKTKGEIMGYLMRREGDNSKAVAKLVQIARTEPNEELRAGAISQLAKVKGDEGANHLVQVYDSQQDAKMKQRVIRSLAYNKSRKAIDKLIQIARADTDPAIRQSAIRSLYGIDNRLYLDVLEKGKNISLFDINDQFNDFKDKFQVDFQDKFQFEWDGKVEGLTDKFKFDGEWLKFEGLGDVFKLDPDTPLVLPPVKFKIK